MSSSNLIGFLVNYIDPEQRKTSPTGLLVTHEQTKQIVALGSAPTSKLLAGLFSSGIEYPSRDHFSQKVINKVKPNDLDSFRTKGKEYLKIGRLNLVEVTIKPPLSGALDITEDLKIATTNPFETIKLGSK